MDYFHKKSSASAIAQNNGSNVKPTAHHAFVRGVGSILTIGMLLVVSLLSACDGEVPLAETPRGTLRLIVTGHSPSLANAGEARYASGSIDLVVPIPVAGMLEQLAPVGTYQITYTPPSGYTLASGQQSQRNVTITAGASTEVTFALVAPQAPTGVVRVTVTGLTSPASVGGSALIERTDVTGQASASVNVPGSGSVDQQVLTGTYRVTYTPPAGYQLASGQPNPRTGIAVTQGNTTTASFHVQASSGGGGGGGGPTTGQVLFFSDWRTQIGNTEAAISDGGKCNSMSASASQNGSIIDAPAGFSTHKALRVASTGARDGWLAPTITTLGEVPIGGTRNYRWEHAFHEPALSDAGQHPIQDGGSASSSNWYLSTVNGGGNLGPGQWALEWGFWGNSNWNVGEYVLGARDGQYIPLTKGVVYRIEIQIVRVSATQFRFHSWIHDSAGNLLYDDDDFHARDASASLADNPLQSMNIPANATNFLIGLNGIANAPWPIHSSDQAAVAVVQGLAERVQIGAYGNVPGEVRR